MHLRTALVETKRLSDALLCDLSKFLLAKRTGTLDDGPLLNALHAKGMPAVDDGLLLFEVLDAYDTLKDRLLVQISTLLLLFQVIFVGRVLCLLLSSSDLLIGSLFGCLVFNLSLRSCRPRMLLLNDAGAALHLLLARERLR